MQAKQLKRQHGESFITDRTCESFEAACAAARVLHSDFGRIVRVVDQNHVEFAHYPPRQPNRGGRKPSTNRSPK